LQEVNKDIELIKDQIIQLKDFIKDPRISGQIRDLEKTGERTPDNMVRILAILQNWLNFLYQDYANNVVEYLKHLRDLDDTDEITRHLRSITTLKPKG